MSTVPPPCRRMTRCASCGPAEPVQTILTQGLTGLAGASSLFMIAAGLTVTFGVTRIVNFAHGSLVMLGAYVGWTILAHLPPTPGGFLLGVVLSGLVIAGFGALVEIGVLRRLYRAPELLQLLATFAVLLLLQDAVPLLWGPDDLTLPRPRWMRGFVVLADRRFPLYDLGIIAAGPALLVLLLLLFRRTRFGMLVRAATENRAMVAALGIDQRGLFTAVFALGAGLAGIAGALSLPGGSANPGIDLGVIAEAFVVVVIGGLGSLPGAYLAALLIAEVQAFGVLVLPQATLVFVFVAMALVLAVRPQGLLGARIGMRDAEPGMRMPVRAAPRAAVAAGLIIVAVAVAAPLLVGAFGLSVLTEMWLAVLFAASLHLLMGPGGMPSFGHAAWFGIGAYAVALGVRAGWPMEMALGVAMLVAALAAGVLGLAVARVSGVYLAMLTLAAAQIVWAGAFQWVAVTGGDNGLLGVRPASWAAEPAAFYYLALVLGLGGALLLRGVLFAPFGFALRAVRDSPLRAAAIGLDADRLRIAAFALAGAAAGLAGALFALAKRSVFPTYVNIAHSVDALVMVLLGGVQSMAGPIVGAAAYTLLYDLLLQTAFWRAKLGVLILALVLAFPDGIAGAAGRVWRRRP